MTTLATNDETHPAGDAAADPAADPAKLLRLAGMVRSELDEIHALPLDDAARAHLVGCHGRLLRELDATLPRALRDELDAIAPHLTVGAAVSDAELRIAHAQLAGWLEGIFQGVQFALALRGAAAPGRPTPP